MLSEINLTRKDDYCMIPLVRGMQSVRKVPGIEGGVEVVGGAGNYHPVATNQ